MLENWFAVRKRLRNLIVAECVEIFPGIDPLYVEAIFSGAEQSRTVCCRVSVLKPSAKHFDAFLPIESCRFAIDERELDDAIRRRIRLAFDMKGI